MRLLFQFLLLALTAISFCAYGDSSSSSESGTDLYKEGVSFYKKGTTNGYRDAIEQFRQSTKMGNSSAALFLSIMYSKGQGVNKDIEISHNWLEKSAVLGNPAAQHDMGNRYQHGIGWAKDQTKSSAWFLKSAKNGHAHAQLDIANSYYYGRGLKKDKEKAMYWAEQSAAQGVSAAHYQLGMWLKNEKSFAKAVGAAGESFRAAAKLFREEASKGNQESAFRLAYLYDQGYGVEEDNSLAYSLYLKVATQGHHWAQYQLAILYIEGEGVDKDYSEAKRWLNEAALGGLGAAKKLLERF